jgi:DNA-binding transcriptional regulator GbsR (MarR family)
MNALETEFIDFYAQMGRAFGMGDLMMKIFGLLYIEPKDMAMEKIAEKTGYSLATISNAMKTLEASGVVQRKSKPKTRKVFFYLDKNILRMNIRKFAAANEMLVKPAKAQIPSMIEKYKNKVKSERSKEQLKIVKNYYNQMLEFEIIMKKWTKELEKLSQKYQ